MPLPRRRFRRCALELDAARVLVDEEDEIVLESVAARDVVVVLVLYAKDQTGSLVLSPGNWLEFRSHREVSERTAVQADRWKLRLPGLTQRIWWTGRIWFWAHGPLATK